MNRTFLEKIGSSGALLAALACPICFPKLAIVGAALGIGGLAVYEGYFALAVQVLFIVALLGQILAFQVHRSRALIALAAVATAILFMGYYVIPSSVLLQVALAGLVAASVWQYVEMRRCARCALPIERLPR